MLYLMDAFGRLHALSLSTGANRPGWPVKVFTDDRRELNWGALSLVDGSVYVPTASYCDTAGTPVRRPDRYDVRVGDAVALRPSHRRWRRRPWGWGGRAFDPTLNTLFAATSGAFDGGTNWATRSRSRQATAINSYSSILI